MIFFFCEADFMKTEKRPIFIKLLYIFQVQWLANFSRASLPEKQIAILWNRFILDHLWIYFTKTGQQNNPLVCIQWRSTVNKQQQKVYCIHEMYRFNFHIQAISTILIDFYVICWLTTHTPLDNCSTGSD